MKPTLKPFVLLFLLCIFHTVSSQVYYLNNGFTNGSLITTCGGTFFDSNPSGNYSPGEDYSVTFCSGNAGRVIQVIFSFVNISAGDSLFVYDGPNTAYPSLDTFSGISTSQLFITPSAGNFTGCITFRFASGSVAESAGWSAQIRCIYPCTQRITSIPFSTPAQDANGFTNICFGNSLLLGVQTQYPDNDITYHQSDSSSIFHWYFGDGTDSSGHNLLNITHTYKKNGGYYARVNITDSNGCSALMPIHIPVRTSSKPHFNIAVPAASCLFDTTTLQPVSAAGTAGWVDMPGGSFVTLPVSGDSVFLPDDPPKCFTSTILVEQFATGQILNSLSDLKGIFMNMEHSYHGDITIAITAPNGSKVMLKSTTGGTADDGTFLGEPVDESLNNSPIDSALAGIVGKGYQYIFNNTPQYATMWNEASKYTNTFTDNAGRVVTHYYLPAGAYTAEQSLAGLLGTPLNGNWTLEICDKQAFDNGFLFNWKIEFDQSLIPNSVKYTVPILSQEWLPAPGMVSVNNAMAIVSPQTAGIYPYTFRLSDGFGCTYDTTVKVVVNKLPLRPNLGADKKICIGQPTILAVGNPQAQQTYTWSTMQSGMSITIDQPDIYWVKAIDINGCTSTDTIDILPNLPFRINLGHDTMYCASKPNELKPQSLAGIVDWTWNTGDSSASIIISGPGTYWIQGKNTGGCWVRDSIIVSDNPVNNFTLPGDTSICDKTGFALTLYPPANTIITWQNGQRGNSAALYSGKTYSIAADNIGCISTSAMKVVAKPIPIFNLGADTTLCIGYELPLRGYYGNAVWRWSTGATDSFVTATTKGIYWAEASYNGCLYRDSIIFSQKNCSCDIIMPNAFSPNGDGVNDTYKPYIKCFPRAYQLTIFDRYGRQVFLSKDYRALWDGRRNGNTEPAGTYYYILTFYNDDMQKSERLSGSITILR